MTVVWSAINVTRLRIYTSVCSILSVLGLISCILYDLTPIVHKGSDPSSPQPSSVSLTFQSIMFILRSTHSSDDCPAEMPTCMTSEQSPALDRSAIVSNDHANTIAAITADYEPPLEHFKGSNYVGVIIAAALIVSWLVVWGIRALWRKRKGAGQRRTREDKQKIKKIAEERQWLNGMRSEEVVRPQKALDIMKMNDTECGDRWKMTSSTPWRFQVKLINSPAEKKGDPGMVGLSLHG